MEDFILVRWQISRKGQPGYLICLEGFLWTEEWEKLSENWKSIYGKRMEKIGQPLRDKRFVMLIAELDERQWRTMSKMGQPNCYLKIVHVSQ